MMEWERNWEMEAFHYINESIALEKDAAVKVEGKSDEIFWKAVFEKFAPSLKLEFYTSSSTQGSGVGEVLGFKNYARKRLLLCIDSDYRYLLQEEETLNNSYIFQTYTHSVENYNCIAENLNQMLQEVRGDIDFRHLLSEYSKAIYKQLLWTLYAHSIGEATVKPNKKVLCLNSKEIDFDDFSTTISDVKNRVDTFLKGRNLDEKILEKLNQKIKQLGIKETESYLYIQGHSIQDCVVKNIINKLVLSNKEKSKKLKYTWQKSLKNNYLPALENPDASPMHKIKADIEQYPAELHN